MIGSDPTFSVSQFVTVFNQSLDATFPKVGIIGELANMRISKGRWVYFDLKDERSSVRFFGSVANLPGPLEDGMSLEVWGRPRLHDKYGFSVNVATIKVVGEGSIAKAKKLLERKLQAEGLFSEERKRPLPYPPVNIGLITSVESAAYSDFVKILDTRWGNMRIQLADCLVQGADSPGQITEAVEYFNQSASPPQVLVLIRGGGSADDLEAFSTEQVVRAVASSRVPTMVAIGHERDVSLAELAADRRASTPSNAAEMLVPDRQAEKTALGMRITSMGRALSTLISTQEEGLSAKREALDASLMGALDGEDRALNQRAGLLKALDPNAPLKRGFALVRDSKGRTVRSVRPLKKEDELAIRLSDGRADVKVVGKEIE